MSFAALDCERISVDLALTAARERVPALERELVEALGKQLAAALAPFANGRDDGVTLFIDRLVIADAIGGRWDPDVIVRKVASRIAAAVSAEIDGGGGLRFRDRAEFVAAFLAALADGSAWSRWWFAEFEGFKALSASNALRSVVLAEEETGFAALARLTAETARRVLATVNRADQARILAAFQSRASLVQAPVALLWRESLSLHETMNDAPGKWLGALLTCERAVAGSASQHSLADMLDMRRLRELAHGLALEIAGRDPAQLREYLLSLVASTGQTMEWLVRAKDSDLQAVRSALATQDGMQAGPRRWTPFGGVLLLLGTMARLDWFDRWRMEAASEDCRLLALTVAAEALAPDQAEFMCCDEALLAAVGVSPATESARERSLTFERMLLATQGSTPTGQHLAPAAAAAAELLLAFAARLPGVAGSSADYLRRNLLSLPAAVRLAGDEVRVEFGRAPLDALLVISGLKHGSFELPGQRRVACSPEST